MADAALKLTTVDEFLQWDDGSDRRYQLICVFVRRTRRRRRPAYSCQGDLMTSMRPISPRPARHSGPNDGAQSPS